jgi:hypothetical protein
LARVRSCTDGFPLTGDPERRQRLLAVVHVPYGVALAGQLPLQVFCVELVVLSDKDAQWRHRRTGCLEGFLGSGRCVADGPAHHPVDRVEELSSAKR